MRMQRGQGNTATQGRALRSAHLQRVSPPLMRCSPLLVGCQCASACKRGHSSAGVMSNQAARKLSAARTGAQRQRLTGRRSPWLQGSAGTQAPSGRATRLLHGTAARLQRCDPQRLPGEASDPVCQQEGSDVRATQCTSRLYSPARAASCEARPACLPPAAPPSLDRSSWQPARSGAGAGRRASRGRPLLLLPLARLRAPASQPPAAGPRPCAPCAGLPRRSAGSAAPWPARATAGRASCAPAVAASCAAAAAGARAARPAARAGQGTRALGQRGCLASGCAGEGRPGSPRGRVICSSAPSGSQQTPAHP